MLTDEATIMVEAGRGGDGIISFRHEKYVDKGGPDGGDGGKGGNIIFVSSTDLNVLNDFARKKIFKAENGTNGAKCKKFGKGGKNLEIKVPVGTSVINKATKKTIYDFTKPNESIVIAKGGKGGLGNVHFKSATNRVPREATPGEMGEQKQLFLELKMIADVGLIGKPNAGKSTLISVISNAKVKIADYAFTTLEPNLGVVKTTNNTFIVCDIPGLIEGASQGKGLGHKFLKHILRTRILVHLVDSTSDDYQRDYDSLRKELGQFDPKLLEKKEVVILTKSDLTQKVTQKFKYDLIVSATTSKNIDKLLEIISKLL